VLHERHRHGGGDHAHLLSHHDVPRVRPHLVRGDRGENGRDRDADPSRRAQRLRGQSYGGGPGQTGGGLQGGDDLPGDGLRGLGPHDLLALAVSILAQYDDQMREKPGFPGAFPPGVEEI